jgi:hypothetical protein
MRFQRLSLSLVAALTLSLAPKVAYAQGIVRDPCYGPWDYCTRRDDRERLARDRAYNREDQARARAERQDDLRREREITARIRADDRAEARAASRVASAIQADQRAKERADQAAIRREQSALRRSLRIRAVHFR